MADKTGHQPKPWQFWRRTFSSLKYRNYRLVWLGSCTEHMGEQIEIMASAWLMKELTESPFYLGLLAVFRVGPMVFSALAGGVLAIYNVLRQKKISDTAGNLGMIFRAFLPATYGGIRAPVADTLRKKSVGSIPYGIAIALGTIAFLYFGNIV